MTCVETFKTREAATEKQRLLRDQGIDARVAVDPLESYFPALSTYQGVALIVHESRVNEALAVLQSGGLKKAV